jgi:hypothetical protein
MLANNELERICKEVVVSYFKVIFRYLPGETEGNHEKPQSRDSNGELPECDRNLTACGGTELRQLTFHEVFPFSPPGA